MSVRFSLLLLAFMALISLSIAADPVEERLTPGCSWGRPQETGGVHMQGIFNDVRGKSFEVRNQVTSMTGQLRDVLCFNTDKKQFLTDRCCCNGDLVRVYCLCIFVNCSPAENVLLGVQDINNL